MMLDLIVAVRRLWRSPMSSLLLIATLTLVGGVAAAVLAVAYQVHFQPISYVESGRLIRITGRGVDVAGTANVSPPDFRDLRRRLTTVDSLAAVSPFTPQLTLTGREQPVAIDARRISSRYFETIGVALIAGREFREAEEAPPVRPVVIGERFWQRTLEGREVIGQLLTLNGEPCEVVGIAPDREEIFGNADVWLPMQFPSEAIRGLRLMAVVGRLRDGVTLEQAQQEVAAIGTQLQHDYPSTNANWQPVIAALGDSVSAPLRSSTTLTLVMIVILWIAACAAVAGLALSLTLQRVDELSIRKAIGASTSQVVRAACLEYVLIAVAGSIGAVAVSQWVAGGMRLIGLTPPAYHHDWVLTLAAVLSLVCTAVGSAMVAVAIAWNRSGPKQRATTPLARVPRNLLVSTQVVMALAVVGVAAMLLAGLMQLRSVNPGFDSNHAAYLTIALPPRYATPQSRAQFWNHLIDNVRTAAGIKDAAITSELPFTGQQNPTAFRATTREGQEASVQLRSVSPSYFRAAGIAMHRGRAFSIDDDAKHPNVIVINEALARMMFGTRDPIGERLTLNFTMPPFEAEVIGVATNIRHSGPADPEAPEVYAVSMQTPLPRYTVLVRSDLEPRTLFASLARDIHAIDPDLAVAVPTRWSDAVEERFVAHHTRLALAAILAMIAVLLATISTFGAVAETANARVKEFAVRLALGAAPRALMRNVAGELAMFIALAILLGLWITMMLRSYVRSVMHDVALPVGWPEMTALAVVGIAVTASAWLAVRGIRRIDPARLLRT